MNDALKLAISLTTTRDLRVAELTGYGLRRLHYKVPGLNTIRRAQQLLVDDGLSKPEGVASLVFAPNRSRGRSTCSTLRTARSALNRAIAALEKAEVEFAARTGL